MKAHSEQGHSHPHRHGHSDGEIRQAYAVEADGAGPGTVDLAAQGVAQGAAGSGAQIAYVDCFAGASGDMLLGALVDAGLAIEALRKELAKLDLEGYEIEAERSKSRGLTGTRLVVRERLVGGREPPARHLREIQRLIEQSTLSDRTKARSLEVIGRLGRVEAGIHGVPLGEVHFHEIGAVDTIIDVVGFVAGLELLGVEEVYASAIPLGNGTIETAHGRLPAPAPATLALLASVGAPTVPHPAQTEIVTPTGAALLSGLALFERPAMRVRAVGYGLGQKEFAWVNGLRLWIGDRPAGPGWAHGRATVQAGLGAHSRATVLADAGGAEDRFGQDEVVVIECNLDDSTGEVLGYTMERLFGAGALDVWFTAIQMKKDRPGVLLAALAPWDKVDALCSVLLHETSTLGVRFSAPAQRLKAGRRLRQVMTPWGEVQVKEKWLGADRANRSSAADKVVPGECISVSPEYEDCARLARAAGVPLMRVMDAARRAAACPDTGEQIGAHDRAPVPAGDEGAGDEGAGARACDE